MMPPKPETKRLPKGKAVTIGIGIKCVDGIVLCADTQMTRSGFDKFYEHKIRFVERDDPFFSCIAFTYAGSPELMKMFFEKFSNIFKEPHYIVSLAAVRQTIDDLLDEMGDLIANDPDGLFMLCGITMHGQPPVLLKSSGRIVCPGELCDYVGVGDSSVVRYLSKVLFQSSAITVNMASLLGTYLVLQAKTFIGGCGGETDSIQILPDGMIHIDLRQDTLDYEDRTGKLENLFAQMISSLSNPEERKRLDQDVERFVRGLKNI